MPKIFSTITDIILTENTFKDIYKDKDVHKCIQAFEIENDSISKLYSIRLFIDAKKTSLTEANLKNALKKFVQFKIEYIIDKKKKYKYFSGIIDEIKFLGFKDKKLPYQYEIVLRPYLYLLTKNISRRSWINKNTKDIISIILNNYINHYKIEKLEVKFQFISKQKGDDSYLKYKNKIQYDISDYDLICQLMQDDTLNYLIEQTPTGQNIIFTDEIEDYFNKKKEDHEFNMEVNEPSLLENNENQEHVQFFGYTHSIKSDIDYVSTSFIDSRNYGTTINSHDGTKKNAPFQYEFFPNLQKSSTLLTSSTAWSKNLKRRKNSNNDHITFTEKRHVLKVGDLLNFVQTKNSSNKTPLNLSKYIISSIKHIYARSDNPDEFNLSNVNNNLLNLNCNYCAEIVAYPIDKKYQEDFSEIKNNIPGVITAKIYGKSPDKPLIETDKAGILLGVSFHHWQTDDKQLQCSTYSWARLSQPWASKEYGSIFIPSPDDEVVLSFEGGDPDLPIIIGSLYNNLNKIGVDLTKEEDKNKRGFIFGEKQIFIITSKEDKKSFVSLNKENFKINTKNAEINASDNTKIVSESSIEVNKNEVKINKLNVKKV